MTHPFPPFIVLQACLCGFAQVLIVPAASAVHPIKKQHHLFTGAIKEVKQQAAQSPSPQKARPKQVGNDQDVQDIDKAAAKRLTDDNNRPQLPCTSLQAQANISPSLTSSDQGTVTRAEKKCLTDQPRLHDSRRGHNSPLAASNQAKSSSMIKGEQSNHGAAANSFTADICSSMGHVTKPAAPPQPAKIELLRPQESYSSTSQYQPLKDMAQGLRVSAFICLCCV